MIRFLLRRLIELLYRFRGYNDAVLRAPGPVLLLPNHVSWWDWLFIGVCLDDDWRFVTSSVAAETSWVHKRIMVNRRTFPVNVNSPFAVKHMAEYLQRGGRLVLFPEGRISTTGSLMKLFDGTGFLIFKTRPKVVTAYIRGAWRLPFSRNPDKKKWFPRVSVHFSNLLEAPACKGISTTAARGQLTDWLRDQMMKLQFETEMSFGPGTLPEAISRAAREHAGKVIVQDATLRKLRYRGLMIASRLLSRQWQVLLRPEGPRVGVLLPNVGALPVVLMSLWEAGKVPAVLNYTTGPAVMLKCAKLADLRQIITSRAFLERSKLDLDPLSAAGIEFLLLEDVRPRISFWQKLHAFLRNFPRPHLLTGENPFGVTRSENVAVVLFTSGSEGDPKAVELTHANVLANIRQMLSVIDLVEKDRFFTALPLFHSFGLTIGLLLPLIRGVYTFVYLSPLHYRLVPSLLYDLQCTVFFGTNTFLAGYGRKAHPYDFHTLRYLISGAEKLQERTATLWTEKFGVRVIEGYGATECSPCITANTPMRPRHGSVGEFLPGIERRIEPVEGIAEGGRLFVRGPNVMRGYLNADANEAFRALGGWYDTGDIVRVEDGRYVFIQGRLKRFAKISGEMVSLTAVEEALLGAFPAYGLRFAAAVVARPDETKGEKLIVVSNDPRLTLEEVREAIRLRGLGNLAVPREMRVLREIPRLGSGKINHRELEKLL